MRQRKPRHTRSFPEWEDHEGNPVKPSHQYRHHFSKGGNGFFVEVFIWPRFKDLKGLLVKGRKNRKPLGLFNIINETSNKHRFRSRKIGEIHLCAKAMTYNTVVHECYHATREWAARAGIREPVTHAERNIDCEKGDAATEERVAWNHGHLCDRVIDFCIRATNEADD